MAILDADGREYTPEPPENPPTIGLIRLLDRKSGDIINTHQIFRERVTIGRDLDCDIRLYQDSVSRLHATIDSDLNTYLVDLNVLGSNGVTIIDPNGGKHKLSKGATYRLSHNDRFAINKIHFAFEAVDPVVQHANTISAIQTPQQIQSQPHRDSSNILPASPLPTRVPANIAFATPKGGRMSLLKHTVLHSARKQWLAQRPPGLDGAVEEGKVELKRKSLSPRQAAAVEALPDSSDGENDEDYEEEGSHVLELSPELQLQWIAEDMSGEKSFASESADSQEENMSFEIPGQGILKFETDSNEHQVANALEEVDVAMDKAAGLETPEYEEEEMEESGDEEDEHDEQAVEEHVTPIKETIPSSFYTPQIARNPLQNPRRSLAGIGAPAWRPSQYTPSANPLSTPAFRPTSKGKSQVDVKEEHEVKAEEADGEAIERATGKARLSEAQIEAARRRRETLGTPRTLPAAPLSFRTPVPAARSTPSRVHPAIVTQPSTPLADLRARVEEMKRTSTRPAPATVGRPRPPTSSMAAAQASLPYVTPMRSRSGASVLPIPLAPTLEAEEGDTSVSSFSMSTPTRGTGAGRDQVVTPLVPGKSESSPRAHPKPLDATRSSTRTTKRVEQPATPDLSGLRHMLSHKVAPTPRFAGLRDMLDPQEQDPSTPEYSGLKHMLSSKDASTPKYTGIRETMALPVAAASTPNMSDVRKLYPKLPPATPDMGSLADMYASPMPKEASEGESPMGSDLAQELAEEEQEHEAARMECLGAETEVDEGGASTSEEEEEVEERGVQSSPVRRSASVNRHDSPIKEAVSAPVRRSGRSKSPVKIDRDAEQIDFSGEESEKQEVAKPRTTRRAAVKAKIAISAPPASASTKSAPTRASRTVKAEPLATASAEEQQQSDPEVKSAPTRRATRAKAPVKEAVEETRSAPTRRTARVPATTRAAPARSTRGAKAKVAAMQDEDKENVEERPSRSTRSRR